MHKLTLIPLILLLAGCGVGGEPSHPEQKVSFSGSLSMGASHSF